MKSVLDPIEAIRQQASPITADISNQKAKGPVPGILPAAGLAFLSILGSALLSGAMVYFILRFGAGSGLPRLEFRSALALALLGTWFSMGGSESKERNPQDFPKYLARTLAHQAGCALLMAVLLGVLSLGFEIGGR